MMAADGRCKTFDVGADGYVRGEGCGMVVFKRLSDAERDGDSILAVIRGSAVNHDGRSNGMTAPNGLAQEALLGRRWRRRGSREWITSRRMARGPRWGIRSRCRRWRRCWAGRREETVGDRFGEDQIGHLEAAAGVAGLIKTVLALEHGEIPAHLHLEHDEPAHRLGRGCRW